MIHFRYHVVSILAVFLAIAIGTVMGASFVGRGVVDRLQNRIDTVENRADEIKAKNEALETEVGELRQYADESAPFAVGRTLDGATVAVVAERGVDGPTVDAQVELAAGAGATVPGVVWLEERWRLDDEESATALREATGITNRGRNALRSAAASSLGARLGGVVPPESDDLLVRLADAEFVTLAAAPGGPDPVAADFGGIASRTLLVGGPNAALPGSVPREVVSGVVGVGGGATVGQIYPSGDDQPPRAQWIDLFSGDDELRNQVSTIDNLDRIEGRVAAVLALAGIPGGVTGHYGLDRERLLPETVPAPAPVVAAA